MNSAEEQLDYIRRYAAVLRPEFVYDTAVVVAAALARGMDAAPADDDDLRPVPMLKARVAAASTVLPVSDLEFYTQCAADTLAYGQRRLRPVKRRVAATDVQPQSDLEFYTQCAAEATRLA